MTALPTAKILLFIALHLGPHQPATVYATSNTESYVWTSSPTGWNVEGLGFPASDFTRDPSWNVTNNETPGSSSVPKFLRSVAKHDWSRPNSAMVFDNGDRVEKHGDHAFYIVNAGGPNEKVFTILYPAK